MKISLTERVTECRLGSENLNQHVTISSVRAHRRIVCFSRNYVKISDKVRPRTGPEGSVGDYRYIDIDIFVNCNWVVTRWQYTFTHKQYIEQYKTNNTYNNTTILEECGPCPVLASITMAFALQPRKKHGKTCQGSRV